ADLVVNHRNRLDQELENAGEPLVDYILCLNATDTHWHAMCAAIAPQGHICSVVDARQPVELDLLKSKSVTFSWEFMFTRPMFKTSDMIEQQRLLNTIAELIDSGTLKTTLNKVIRPINAEHL